MNRPYGPSSATDAVRREVGAAVIDCLGRGDLPDAAVLRARWQDLVTTPPWPGPPVWLHGDLHPGNLTVATIGGRDRLRRRHRRRPGHCLAGV
ncbi:phosphotransferase [Cryptosporangium japonicum]|uniref:phosphotransferase n=1 Tax=Cryptosporangium japonicum TaxID=80872 RepID=UPI003CD0A470